MDSITQAVLGASIGEAVLGKKLGNKAWALGAAVATLPDLDIVLYPLLNDFQKISFHRGYSHSFVFCLLLSFLLSYLFSKWKYTKAASFSRLTFFNILALSTHVLLDAFTSYGTQLFLPWTDARISFDSIGIVDPVYTLPMLICLVIAIRKYPPGHRDRERWNGIGIFCSTAYLLFTLVHKQIIEGTFEAALSERGITYQRLLTVPVSAANLKWYGAAKSTDSLYLGNYTTLSHDQIDFEAFAVNDSLLDDFDEGLTERLKWFAKGFYTVSIEDGRVRMYNMQCDMQGIRYYGGAKVPTAFYFEIEDGNSAPFKIRSGMHLPQSEE